MAIHNTENIVIRGEIISFLYKISKATIFIISFLSQTNRNDFSIFLESENIIYRYELSEIVQNDEEKK